jgi:hypothetical protein
MGAALQLKGIEMVASHFLKEGEEAGVGEAMRTMVTTRILQQSALIRDADSSGETKA